MQHDVRWCYIPGANFLDPLRCMAPYTSPLLEGLLIDLYSRYTEPTLNYGVSAICVLVPGLETTKKLPTSGETENEGGKKQVK